MTFFLPILSCLFLSQNYSENIQHTTIFFDQRLDSKNYKTSQSIGHVFQLNIQY